MTSVPIISLLTDFGDRDPYVGVMKGVILGICPEARLIDLTHRVSPQQVAEGAYQLARACTWFPPRTIHLAVVDPGVGSQRRAVVVRGRRSLYVAPDNGLLSLALMRDPMLEAFVVTAPEYTLPSPSRTFHGRDVFAPVAAHLAAGVPPQAVGRRISELMPLELAPNRPGPEGLITSVVLVDGFGNLITNARPEDLPGPPIEALVGHRRIPVAESYAAAPAGSLLALWGSDERLEIAVNCGSAAAALGAAAGTEIVVRCGRGGG